VKLAIDFRHEAIGEIDAAYEWYSEQHVGLAEQFLDALLKQFSEIQSTPARWAKLYRQIRACPMRRFPFVIYYQLFFDQVTIIAVQHGHRSPRAWRSRA